MPYSVLLTTLILIATLIQNVSQSHHQHSHQAVVTEHISLVVSAQPPAEVDVDKPSILVAASFVLFLMAVWQSFFFLIEYHSSQRHYIPLIRAPPSY